MGDSQERVRAEFELVERTLSILKDTLARPYKETPEWMAVAGFISNVYAGIENILKNVLRARDIALPEDPPSFHRDLLDRSAEYGLVGTGLREQLDEYRAFRHFFVHAYGLMLKPDQLEPLAERLPCLWTSFRAEIERGFPENRER